MRKMRLFIPLTILFISITNVSFGQNEILGHWLNEEKDAIIEISNDGGIFNGRIVWLEDSLDQFKQPMRDVLNDKSSLRSRTVKGVNMLTGFVYNDGDWKGGEIYNFESGNDYNGKITLDEAGHLRLKGYYSILFFLGRTKTWTRPAQLEYYGLR